MLIQVLDTLIAIDRIPNGVYCARVMSVPGEPAFYIRVVDGVASEISKAEYESDVPTVDPPY